MHFRPTPGESASPSMGYRRARLWAFKRCPSAKLLASLRLEEARTSARMAPKSITAPPPAPAPPQPGAARRSSPSPGTFSWPSLTRYAPTLADPSWHTGCPDRGDSAPTTGACRVPRPGRGRAGRGLPLAHFPGAHAVRQSRRGGAGHTPGGRVPGAHG